MLTISRAVQNIMFLYMNLIQLRELSGEDWLPMAVIWALPNAAGRGKK